MALKPLGDAFVALIRMMIAPIVFCVVVQGISSMGNLKQVGRVGLKALVYFEVVSTLALVVGILVGYALHPGSGFNINPATLDPQLVSKYVDRTRKTWASFRSCWESSPPRYLTPSSRATCWRCCSSPSCSVRHRANGRPRRDPGPDDRWLHESAFCDHPNYRASRSHRRRWPAWRSRSAVTALVSLSSLAKLIGTFYVTAAIFVSGRSGTDRVLCRLLDPELHRLHQGRTADRAGHQFVGDRASRT